jgi:hypothetical protein
VFADLIRAKQHLVLPLDMGQSNLQQVCVAVAWCHLACMGLIQGMSCAVSEKASARGGYAMLGGAIALSRHHAKTVSSVPGQRCGVC